MHKDNSAQPAPDPEANEGYLGFTELSPTNRRVTDCRCRSISADEVALRERVRVFRISFLYRHIFQCYLYLRVDPTDFCVDGFIEAKH